jgi:hypothetical protein
MGPHRSLRRSKSGTMPRAMTPLTDDEAKALADALNRHEPQEVHETLDAMSDRILRHAGVGAGAVASGPLDFGSVEPGVLIYRTDSQHVRMRITVSEMTGGVYDDLELPPDAFRELVAALLEALEKKAAP